MILPLNHQYIDSVIQEAYSLQTIGNHIEATQLYLSILESEPNNYNALHLLGVIELENGHPAIAAELMERAVTVVDSDPSAYNNLGEAYRRLDRLRDAERCYRRAVELADTYAIAYNNLAITLHLLKESFEAEIMYRIALSITPDYAEASNNLGILLASQDRFEESEEAYLRAIACNDMYVVPLINLGILYKNWGRYRESETCYRKAHQLTPYSKDVLYNLSLLKLLQGKLKQGFALYEYRAEKYRADAAFCEWSGDRLDDCSLLVIVEQGAGDTLMMSRYLPKIKQRFNPTKIGVYCESSLQRLLLGIKGVDVCYTCDAGPPPVNLFSCYCSMMSLPYLFKTNLSTIPGVGHLFSLPEERVEFWRMKLAALSGVKVGFVWAGNKSLEADSRRSIPLVEFKPIAEVSGCTFVSLQKGERAVDLAEVDWFIYDFMNECVDYLDTAALVVNLDLVISVDTSVAHLAGILGKKVWLLNRYESEWRWMLNHEDSPWYPTMRIFRQETRCSWSSTLQSVARQLLELKNNSFLD